MSGNISKSKNLVWSAKPNGISFDRHGRAEVFCWSINRRTVASVLGGDSNPATGRWCDKTAASDFLNYLSEDFSRITRNKDTLTAPRVSFALLGCYGNGTLHPLSLDRDLFDQATSILRVPERAQEVIQSIHGVFATFLDYDDDDDDNANANSLCTLLNIEPEVCTEDLKESDTLTSSKVILFSTPKAPVREIFCAIRITTFTGSTGDSSIITCLLFDAQKTDLEQTIAALRGSGVALQSPAALLAVLLKECGRTSESVRDNLDAQILQAEVQTKSTPWYDPGKSLVKWPDDFYSATSVLYLCNNNLLFVGRAVDVEIDSWTRLMGMMERMTLEGKASEHRLMLRGTGMKNRQWRAILDDVRFEVAHTANRRAQVECLKARIQVQMDLINNMIAHQEGVQTNLIAFLALIFAPASLIASIYSSGVFATDETSWVSYLASTLPATFATVIVGIGFLERQAVVHAWRSVRATTLAKMNKPQVSEGAEIC